MNTINKDLRDKLETVQSVFGTTQDLCYEPTLLEQNNQNGEAFAHSLRLSAFDYPSAFVFNDENLPLDVARQHFNITGSKTFAVGEGRRILGAATLIPAASLPFSLEPPDDPSIEHIFRIRGASPALEGVGRRLLHRVIGEVIDQGQAGAECEIVSTNTKALQTAKELGFRVKGVEDFCKERPCKVIRFGIGSFVGLKTIQEKLR